MSNIRITGDGPKITATGSGSTVLVEISTGQHDPGSFSGVHNDLTGRSTTGAHVGTAVSIDPTGFNGNLDGTITNAQLLAAAVDDLVAGGGGGGGGAVDSVDGRTGAVTLSDLYDAAGAAQAVADTLGDAATKDVGTTAGTVAAGDDARLSDARNPVSHNHAASEVTSGTLDIARIPTGTTSTTVPLGNDSRFTDARTPTSHASSHASAGSDPVTLAQSQVTNLTTDLAGKAASSHSHAGTDITSGTVGTARLGSGSASPSTFLRGDQTWATPSGIADPGGSNDDFLQRKSGAWTNRTVAQVKTDLGITGQPPPTAKVVGYYAPSGLTAGNMTSPLTAAGTMAAAPVFLWAGSYTEVGNAYHYSGTSTVRFGLYDATGTGGYPGSLVSGADFGTISCVNGSPGAKSITISFTLATSGWFWIAALCDAYTSTGEFVGYSVANGYGPMKAAGFPTAGDSNGASCVTKTGVTTGSMPSTFGTPTSYTGIRFPAIRLYLNS